MSFLGKLFGKGDAVSDVAIPAEIYRSTRVMRDDIDEMEGKPKESFPGSSSEQNSTQAGNPFLGAASAMPVPDSSSGKPVASFPVSGAGKKKPLIFAAIGASILIVALFAVYFFLWRADDSAVAPELPSKAVGQETVPVSEELPSVPKDVFSVGTGNYLQVDPESDTATPDGIFAKLADSAGKVKAMGASDPIEFLIRDMNNNPIAFSRFSYLAKLGIPEDTLALADEAFSLYMVPEGGEIRFALSIETKDAAGFSVSVSEKEADLPTWFGRLLYDPATDIPASVSFRSGTHGSIPTRFSAVDEARGYSFDYAFVGKKWVIGTSKDSFRSVLEKIVIGQVK
ncbi:MAG: hypothetical protein KBD19_04240 [Candidatus Moranbacteria bacterium]|nr:hypothetical protein [Candidatus Moranbacteria bacterium]